MPAYMGSQMNRSESREVFDIRGIGLMTLSNQKIMISAHKEVAFAKKLGNLEYCFAVLFRENLSLLPPKWG